MSASTQSPPRGSYIAAAFRKRENQLAAAIAIALAALVAALAQVPLQVGFEIDMRRAPDLRSPRHASFVGFGAAGPAGRTSDAPVAKIVMNRPLPARFLLEIEGRAVGDRVPQAVEVRVGSTDQTISLTEDSRIHSFRVENSAGSRTISLGGTAPLRVAITRVAVR